MPKEVRACSSHKMCVLVEMDAYWYGVNFQLITVALNFDSNNDFTHFSRVKWQKFPTVCLVFSTNETNFI